MRQLADTLSTTFTIPTELELTQVEVNEDSGSIRFNAYILVDKVPVGRFSSEVLDDNGVCVVDFISDQLRLDAMRIVTPDMIAALKLCPWANANGTAGTVRTRAFTHALYALLEPHVLQIILPMTECFLIRQSGYTDFYFLSFDSERPIVEFLSIGDQARQQQARESFSSSYIAFINQMERHERIVNDPGRLRTLRLACVETSNHRQWEGTF